MSKETDEKISIKPIMESNAEKSINTSSATEAKKQEPTKEEPKRLKLNIDAQAYIPKAVQKQFAYGHASMIIPQAMNTGVASSIYHKPGTMLQSTYLYNNQLDNRKYYQPMPVQGNPLISMTNAPTPENIQKMLKSSKPFFPKNVQTTLNKDDLAKKEDDKKVKMDTDQDKKEDKASGKLSGLVDNKEVKIDNKEEQLKIKKQKEEADQLRIKQQRELAEKKEEEEEKKNYKTEGNYFLVPVNESKSPIVKHRFNLEYMMSFKQWKISQETKQLSEELINHLAQFKKCEEELPKNPKEYQKNHHNNKRDYDRGNKQHQKKRDKDEPQNFSRSSSEVPTPTSATEMSIGQWGRKDITKELEQAELFKEKMNEVEQRDPLKFQLTELLNILTVDNYEETKEAIFNMVQESVDHQEKFLDVLFTKAVNEKAFVFLYAKLCKDLDKKLPQKSDKIMMNKKATSAMRSKLLDKSREIFKIENNTKFDSYINLNDPDERELKMKKFVLGNVNFISELINIQVLSKKIVFQCIENLFKRYEKEDGDEILHLINLEAIVIMMDKFGTLVKNQQKKIKPDDLKEFNSKIDEIIENLDKIQLHKKLPGFIKYKIINLIEKKKDNWEESQFEKISVAKGKEEVRKEYENSLLKPSSSTSLKDLAKYSQEAINKKMREDLSSWKEHIEDGLKPENYNWEIIEDIYSVRKHSLAEILLAYVETCIDFVSKADKLKYATLYFKDLISFYSRKLKENEREDVVFQAIKLLQEVSNFSLDNDLIIDVWGHILYYLLKEKVMLYSDFNTIPELFEDDIKAVFQVFGKVIELEKEAKGYFSNIKLVKENVELFTSITNS